jgi:phage FluMu gp28-like protein
METKTVAELSTRQLLQEIKPELAQVLVDVDPAKDGFLMKHQQAWVADQSPLKLAEKGRRTGITFAEAFDDVIVANTARSEGGDNTFYIGDTKPKGREFIATCAMFREKLLGAGAIIERFEYSEGLDPATSKTATGYRLVDPVTGNRIEGLSSNPANIRGLQGRVVIDEAAFHPDVVEVMKAVNALLIGFGVIRVISSHNGVANAFNQVIQETRAGIYDYVIHKVTFDDAVANGLYERLARARGRTPTEADKAEWYRRIRRSYGSDLDAMREELDAIPKKSAIQYLSRVLIESCVESDIPVVRLEMASEFGRKPPREREDEIAEWLQAVIEPLLKKLNPRLIHVVGSDFARSGDASTLIPLAIMPNLRRKPPFIIETKNVPFEQQQQIYRFVIRGLRRFSAGAFDATGNGAQVAEHVADHFGHERIHQIKLSSGWYDLNMPKLRKAFEDLMISVPADELIVEDLRMVRLVNGVPMVPRETGQKGRHGDSAVAYCLAWFASEQEGYQEFAYEAVTPASAPGKAGLGMRPDESDDDRDVKVTGGFRHRKGL